MKGTQRSDADIIDELVPDSQIEQVTAGFEKGAYISEEGGQYCVKSEEGKSLGCYDTKGEAEKRLGQVEYFKHKDSVLRETDAYKEAAGKFDSWTDEHAHKTWESMGGSEHACSSKMSGHVDDPDAYCSALKDRVKGTTYWRGKGKD